MEWIQVSSSRVSEVAFDSQNNSVYVRFKRDGSVYVYEDISKDIFDNFINAPSIGKAIPLLGKKYRRV